MLGGRGVYFLLDVILPEHFKHQSSHKLLLRLLHIYQLYSYPVIHRQTDVYLLYVPQQKT